MRNFLLLAPLALMLVLSGCVVFNTNPLYTANDLTFDPGLAGVWRDKDGSTWSVRQSGDRQYDIVEGTSDEKSIGRLVRLGALIFLDLESREEGEPVRHMFCRLSRNGDELNLGLMSPEWVRRQIEAKQIRLPHLPLKPGDDEEVVLSAPTKQLQSLVLKYANDPAAFTTMRLERKK